MRRGAGQGRPTSRLSASPEVGGTGRTAGPDAPNGSIDTGQLVTEAATEVVSVTGESGSGSYYRASALNSRYAVRVLEQISWGNSTGAAVTL